VALRMVPESIAGKHIRATRFLSVPVHLRFPTEAAKLNIHMPLSKDLLEILVCPFCKSPVELKPDSSGLKCVQCHRVYPIKDDIPVMLIDEAKIEE
jgi:uncharacterized protein